MTLQLELELSSTNYLPKMQIFCRVSILQILLHFLLLKLLFYTLKYKKNYCSCAAILLTMTHLSFLLHASPLTLVPSRNVIKNDIFFSLVVQILNCVKKQTHPFGSSVEIGLEKFKKILKTQGYNLTFLDTT